MLTCAALAVAGCDDPATAPGQGTPADDVYDPSPGRPVNSECQAHLPPPSPYSATLVRAFDHLRVPDGGFDQATDLAQVGDGRWLLATRRGQVMSFSEDAPGVDVALDLTGRVDVSDRELGLMSVAVDPEFADNGRIFVVYCAPTDGSGRFVARLAAFTQGTDGRFLPDTERVVLDVRQKRGSHNMNQALFGPDGMLYVTLGDDLENVHATADPAVNATEDLGDLRGKILRLDVRAEPYAIPEDNPFVGNPGAAPEVWAYGLRNPWRISLTHDGRALVGDVGQDTREELSLATAGAHLGWPVYEGRLCHLLDRCDAPGFTAPLADYTMGGPKSIVAGPVYDARDIAGLEGRALFADHVLGHIWSADMATGETQLEHEGEFPLTSFTRAADGTVYVVRYSDEAKGGVYRLAPAPAVPDDDFPRLLSDTGCFDAGDPRRVRDGVIPFAPVATLWSDAADKERYFAIPDDRRVAVDAAGGLVFPEGAVLIKHFKYGPVFHETRLYMRSAQGWHGYSYRWDEAQTDAELLDSGLSAELPNGIVWAWPSRSQCNLCHTEASGVTLGLEVAQLDQPLPVSLGADLGQIDNQLEWLFEKGFFAPEYTDVADLRSRMPRLVDPSSASHGLEQRARSYLHVNCASCHQPGGLGRGELDLRIATALPEAKICDVEPDRRVWGYGNSSAQRVVAPGSAEDSTLYLRMLTPGYFRMPPLGTEVVDDGAGELIRQWIDSLRGCD